MTIYVNLKSDMNTLTFDNVECWDERKAGDIPFLYLGGTNEKYRAYILIEDILRITIMEDKNDT